MHSHTPRADRRQAFGSTCLLALPTALALGAPASAQSIISTNVTGTVNLSALSGPVSIATGVSITGTGAAAVSGTAFAQLVNAGQVADASGTGIYLGGGGALSNGGSVSGADGVRLNAAGSIANTGGISATNYGVVVNNGAGQLSNAGSITAGYDGVSLNRGGTVTNTGSIFGAHIGVYTGNALGVVSNSGTISARTGDAVSLYGGGTLTNLAGGALLGGYTGIYAGGNGSHITNAGLITGPLFGAYLMGASSIVNSGTMAGGVDGVFGFGHGAQITNTGLIHGGQAGVKLAANGAVNNSGIITGGTFGVRLGANSTLANAASGHIAGGATGVVAAAGDVLRNSGTITGAIGIAANGPVMLTDTGLISGTSGTAISLGGGASQITLGSGAQISGAIAGGGTASQITLTGSGTLSSDLTNFAAGSALTVTPSAAWMGTGHWQIGTLVNQGYFTPGALGTPLSLSGDFTQTSTGTLRVLVSPNGISGFAISGVANLGGTLDYVLAPGTYQPGSATFLTAGGGTTGAFAQVVTTQIVVAAPPSPTPQAPAAQGPVVAVAQVSGAQALVIGQSFTVAPAGSRLFADAAQAMALGAVSRGAALLDHAASGTAAPCQAPPAASGQAANMAAALASGLCAAGGWLQLTGDTASLTGGYSLEGGGFLGGLDRPNGLGGRIGLAVGYDSANLREKPAGTAGLQTIRLGLYATQPLGRFQLSADIMDSLVMQRTTRATGASAATAKGHANVLSGDVQLALPLAFHGALITPAFGLQIASVTTGRLSETSATQAFAITTSSARGTSLAPYLRLSLQKTFTTASGLAITPDLTLGATATLQNPGAKIGLTAQDGTASTTNPAHLAPLSGQLSAGITITHQNWSITARYTANAGRNWSGQNLQAGVQVRF